MKGLLFFLVIFLTSTSFALEKQLQDCTTKCKAALTDAGFEFQYRSGLSSYVIGQLVQYSCKQKINYSCKLADQAENPEAYLIYSYCIYRETKLDCEKRYEVNR